MWGFIAGYLAHALFSSSSSDSIPPTYPQLLDFFEFSCIAASIYVVILFLVMVIYCFIEVVVEENAINKQIKELMESEKALRDEKRRKELQYQYDIVNKENI